MPPIVLIFAVSTMRSNLPECSTVRPDRIERAQEQPVGLLGRDQLGRDDGDLLAVGRDGAGQQELLAGDRRDPGDQIAELGVGLQIQLHDPLAGRELLAGVEVLLADQLVRAGDAGRRRPAAWSPSPRRRRRRGRRRPGAGAGGVGRRFPSGPPGKPGKRARRAGRRRRGRATRRLDARRRRFARLHPDRLAVGSGHDRRAQRARAQKNCNHRRDTLCRSSFHRML